MSEVYIIGGVKIKGMVIGMIIMIFMGLSSGCSQNQMNPSNSISKSNNLQEIDFTENQLYAVAYLGYEKLEDVSFYVDKYLSSDNIPIHYFSPGEYYLVIPRYTNMDLLLYKNDMNTMDSLLVYEGKAVQPFIIQCNIGDFFLDATICLMYQNEMVEFSPHISLKDGSIQVGEHGVNITKQT